MARAVHRFQIDQHGIHDATHFDELLPLATVAGKARHLTGRHRTDLPKQTSATIRSNPPARRSRPRTGPGLHPPPRSRATRVGAADPASRTATAGSPGCGAPGRPTIDECTKWLSVPDAAAGSCHSSRASRVGRRRPRRRRAREATAPATGSSSLGSRGAMSETTDVRVGDERASVARVAGRFMIGASAPPAAARNDAGLVAHRQDPARGRLAATPATPRKASQPTAGTCPRAATTGGRLKHPRRDFYRATIPLLLETAPTDRLPLLHQHAVDGDRPAEPRVPRITDVSELSTMGVGLSTSITGAARTSLSRKTRPITDQPRRQTSDPSW